MKKKVILLKRLPSFVVKNGSKQMTGRTKGKKIREFVEKVLKDEQPPCVAVLDFSGVGSIDFSWADEVVAKIVSRLWSGEYGEKFLLLKNLSGSQVENVAVALERKRLAALATGPDGWQMIGSLNNYLNHTLDQVLKKGKLTLKELSEEEGIGLNTSGTRLLNLYRKRLVMRVEGAGQDENHRGKPFVYQPLLP